MFVCVCAFPSGVDTRIPPPVNVCLLPHQTTQSPTTPMTHADCWSVHQRLCEVGDPDDQRAVKETPTC